MGVEFGKAVTWLIDPGRTFSSITKTVTGSSIENMFGSSFDAGSDSAASSSNITTPSKDSASVAVDKASIKRKTRTILARNINTGSLGTSSPTLLGTGDTTKKATLG